MKKDLRIMMAQIKILTGSLDENTNKILDNIKKAIDQKIDVIIFPELSVTGYNCNALFLQKHFLEYQMQFINKKILPNVPNNLIVILGFVRIIGNQFDGNPQIANSAAVIQGGKIIDTCDKILLANGGHHDDRRYFTAGNIPSPIEVELNGELIKLGIVICEDIFYMDHRRNIPKEMANNGADILISINQSYFYYGKQNTRREICKKHAIDNNLPFIYVNNVGVGDVGKNYFLYDGGSIFSTSKGEIIESNRFAEDFTAFQLDDKPIETKLIDYKNKYEEIFDALVFSVKNIFKDSNIDTAQIHMSGGVDSSVCLPILVEALGKDNVIAISNPSQYNKQTTKSNAQYVCDMMNVKLYWQPIEKIQQAFINAQTDAFGRDSVKPDSIGVFDAVGRTVCGLSASHFFKSAIVPTGNHTENVLGFCSFHDIGSIGICAPILDLTKVEVFGLSEYIVERYGKQIIPKSLYDGSIEGAPSAELADNQESDPFEYYVYSGICAEIIRERKDIKNLIEEFKSKTLNVDFFPKNKNGKDVYGLVDLEIFKKNVMHCFKLSKISVFKSMQHAPGIIISKISRGYSSRESLINHYKGEYNF